MAQVLHQSQSHFSSPSSTSSSLPTIPCALPTPHEASFCQPALINSEEEGEEEEEGRGGGGLKERRREREGYQLPLLAILVRSLVGGCRRSERDSADLMCSSNSAMEIGLPTNVRHVAHVTFDRFNGFLGLPVEFEPEVPRRPPSASTSVFGVSTESMQLSFDPRGNSVPTILLMMQRHLYAQGGLEAEGIFRINAGNSQEEYVRGQLNRGVVPDGIDVHCLAGLIKAWFRELPTGLLDSLSPEQVMQSQTEEQCIQLVHVLPPTEMALLDWAVNLMTDVAQLEHTNKMNARNVAMVFAPNMTQMSDPLTALMHAVQVMNFLKTLIIKTLRERQDSSVEPNPTFQLEPPDDNGHCNFSLPHLDEVKEENEEEQEFSAVEPEPGSPCHPEDQEDNATARAAQNLQSSPENTVHVRKLSSVNNLKPENSSRHNKVRKEPYVNSPKSGANPNICRIRSGQMGDQKLKKGPIKVIRTSQKSLGATKFSRMNSTDWVETWR